MLSAKQIAKHITGKYNLDLYREYGDVLPADGLLVFQDNGADVLVVAHLDVVKWNKPKIRNNHIFHAPQLDDRLGVAAILEWLPNAGLGTWDVLLCDKEEIGQSTASAFIPPRHYRYMVEFDRAGSDCVFYQYRQDTLEYSFKEAGWETGYGSFSDISSLDHLECQGVNIGIGYHGQHTDSCRADLIEVNTQLAKFAMWWQYYGKDSFPFDNRTSYSWHDRFGDDDYDLRSSVFFGKY